MNKENALFQFNLDSKLLDIQARYVKFISTNCEIQMHIDVRGCGRCILREH